MEKTVKNERQSNIELLRILAIFLIIIFHIGRWGIKPQIDDGINAQLSSGYSFNWRLVILEITQTFGQIGNDLFILITGFFLTIKGEINVNKAAKKIFLQLGFVSVLITLLSYLYYRFLSADFIGLVGIDIFNSDWWFAGYYIGILAVACFLNPKLNNISRDRYLALIFILFAIVSTSFLGDMMEGWTTELRRFITGIMLYCFGGYIRLYNPFRRIKSYKLVLLSVLIMMLYILSYYNSVVSGQNVAKLSDYNYVQTVDILKVFSIVPLVISIIIFELFTRIKMGNDRTINSLASASFMIFILHDNIFIHSVMLEFDLLSFFFNHTFFFILFWLGWGILVYVIGYLVFVFYSKLIYVVKKLLIDEDDRDGKRKETH